MKDLFDLTGKIALVTGASRGIGESIARLLASRGAHVIVSSRKIDACQAVADSIVENGDKASAFACHVGEMDQIETIFAHIKDEFGRIDILVNNAAANPYYGHILNTDLAAFEKTVDVNIRGYFFMSTTAGQMMAEQGGGVILNTASVNGIVAGDKQGIYSITKAAVISMTKSFAKECGPLNIRVNALLPGLTDTKFASALTTNDKVLKMALHAIPLGRVADPDEMAGTVLYLVSDASSYTTGACILVDGGMLA
ncbi:SDR family oxidoreductase [Psychrobacter sp. DM4]|uniref:SDR family oxidoreductase n=1 Tax=Psychrobacter sp. DM4 TaxID=3440637 RepID=UPI003F4F71B3